MSYIEGFVAAVPAANKEIYRRHAAEAVPLFKSLGATRMVETWADDVPDGKLNDFKGAVKAKPDEVVVFSWVEYPSKAVRDAANAKMTSDPNVQSMSETMPFDGKRMIWGGFSILVEARNGRAGPTGYVDGCLIPVKAEDRARFETFAQEMAAVFKDHGALRVVDAWGDDLPDGKVTDYRRAVLAEDGETVVYGWVEWPSKEVRARGWEKVMADPRLQSEDRQAPFDGRRMVYGGFAPIVDS